MILRLHNVLLDNLLVSSIQISKPFPCLQILAGLWECKGDIVRLHCFRLYQLKMVVAGLECTVSDCIH